MVTRWKKLFNTLKDARSATWTESKVAKTFTNLINKHQLTKGMKLALSQLRSDKDESSKQRVDGAFFKTKRAPKDGKPHWADQLVSVEFNSDKAANDPFDDLLERIDTEVEPRMRVRARLIAYAELVFKYQHHTALYILLIIGRSFRVIRYDRSGMVTTPRIDYVEKPELLIEFLWRISHASDETLGIDPTAIRLAPGTSESKLMLTMAKEVATDLPYECITVTEAQTKAPVFTYVREMFRKSLQSSWPWWKLQVPQPDGTDREFLVGKPYHIDKGMAGRGTLGYVALMPEEKKFGDTLQELKEKGVMNIPTFICHGDIPGQTTQTPDVWQEIQAKKDKKAASSANSPGFTPGRAGSDSPTPAPTGTSRKRVLAEDNGTPKDTPHPDYDEHLEQAAAQRPLRRHVHYRLVVEEVGLYLKHFVSGYHLLNIIYDCLGAPEAAGRLANVLHRDISGGNILIHPRFETDDSTSTTFILLGGLLIDWEMAKKIVPGNRRQARQPERTGTWQYMSVALLTEPGKIVEIPDELESFFHVLLHYAVRYLVSNQEDQEIAEYVEGFFEAYKIIGRRYRCGNLKYATMTTDGPLRLAHKNVTVRFNSPLDLSILSKTQWFSTYYAVREVDKKQKRKVRIQKRGPGQGGTVPACTKRLNMKIKVKPHNPRQKLGILEDAPTKMMDEAPPAPSQATRDLTGKLETHHHLMSLFWEVLSPDNKFTWPDDNRLPDRVPPGLYKPKLPVAPPETQDPGRGQKRRKTDNVAGAPPSIAPALQLAASGAVSSYADEDTEMDTGSAFDFRQTEEHARETT
ncbi:hypothetical protein BD413DRAFT_616528 [Trametes elegans]|nr:hypothetical protein BD413DRAFT_616528 [Trametes elegans]